MNVLQVLIKEFVFFFHFARMKIGLFVSVKNVELVVVACRIDLTLYVPSK